jgi:hypothetical protein
MSSKSKSGNERSKNVSGNESLALRRPLGLDESW